MIAPLSRIGLTGAKSGLPADWPERASIAALLVAGIVFIAVGIERPLFADEAYSVLIAGRGASGIVDGLSRDNSFPLYYFLLSFWMRLFGHSEIALRSLSAIFYVGGCGVAYALGRRLSGSSRGAWSSAFLYESSPLAICHAQNIRVYALLGFLSGLATLAFLRLFARKDRSWTAIACFVAAVSAGMLSHAWFVFVLLAQFLALLIFERRELFRFVLASASASLPFLLLWGRPFIAQLHNPSLNWTPSLPASFVIVTAVLGFFGDMPAVFLYVIAAAGVLLAGRSMGKWFGRKEVLLVVTVCVGSLALPLLATAVKPIYWPGRSTIVTLAVWAALFGCLLCSVLPKPLLAGFCALVLIFQVWNQVSHRDWVVLVLFPLPPERSDRATARFLLEHASPGDAIVFTSLTRPVADYYFGRAGAAGRFLEISFPAELQSHPGWSEDKVPPEKRAPLAPEAAAAAQQLQRLAAGGKRVWFYEGAEGNVGGLLKQELNARLTLLNTYPLAGPSHRRILRYGAPAE